MQSLRQALRRMLNPEPATRLPGRWMDVGEAKRSDRLLEYHCALLAECDEHQRSSEPSRPGGAPSETQPSDARPIQAQQGEDVGVRASMMV